MDDLAGRYHHLGPSSEGMFDTAQVLAELGLQWGQRVLDVGAGEGRFAVPMAQAVGPNGRVTAVDVQAAPIEALREKVRQQYLRNLQAEVADVAERIPVADGSIDLALAANMLHELGENGVLERGLREIARALKPAGRLAVLEFRPDLDSPPGPPRAARLSPAQIEAQAAPLGLKLERVLVVGPYHYLALLRKQQVRATRPEEMY